MELKTQFGELIDFQGGVIMVLPLESNKKSLTYGVFYNAKLLGVFDNIIMAMKEVGIIMSLYTSPYQVGESVGYFCDSEYSIEDLFNELFEEGETDNGRNKTEV